MLTASFSRLDEAVIHRQRMAGDHRAPTARNTIVSAMSAGVHMRFINDSSA
jgi:hypothetical protein